MDGSLLKEKAKELGTEFSASEGWLTNFKKRNGIVYKKMCEESSSVDINVWQKWQNSLSDLIKEYEKSNSFNTDETGLFFKCLPEKTFTFKKEKCHGGKHSKERREVVKSVLDNLENQQNVTTISILTALIMIDKAWRAVTPLTIHSCFKKSGFPSPNLVDVDNTLTEFNAEPSLWGALPEQDLTFDDFVLVDTDIAVWGALSDAEIVALDHNNTESDEDE
ncbi:uncharacterized protein TNCV_724711 [Trichonephila clavipes]|nr:uncharacterized protein TNCV_724711 [Trichonephila clavipes]